MAPTHGAIFPAVLLLKHKSLMSSTPFNMLIERETLISSLLVPDKLKVGPGKYSIIEVIFKESKAVLGKGKIILEKRA